MQSQKPVLQRRRTKPVAVILNATPAAPGDDAAVADAVAGSSTSGSELGSLLARILTALNKPATVAEPVKIEPLAHSPERAAKRLGISTRAVYGHIATGELRSFKDGKRRLIPDAECQRFITRRMAAAA